MTENIDSPPLGGDDETETVSWWEVLATTESRMAAAGLSDQEARWVVDEASGAESTADLGELATVRGMAYLKSMVERRLGGEPLQYVLGRWAFRTLDLMVDSRVLIPRPETEVVAGLALGEIDRVSECRNNESFVRVADLGTGSGAIGLSMAAERPKTRVWCVDVSKDALSVARANCAGLGRPAQRVVITEGSWFQGLPADLAGRFDVIVSNPPYVAPGDYLSPDVAEWEPVEALFSPGDGMTDLRTLIGGSLVWLAPGGSLVLEMAPHQAGSIAAEAADAGYANVVVHEDLAGRDRVLVARSPE